MSEVLWKEYPRTTSLLPPAGKRTEEGRGNMAVVGRQGKKAMASASMAKAERVLEAREYLAVPGLIQGP